MSIKIGDKFYLEGNMSDGKEFFGVLAGIFITFSISVLVSLNYDKIRIEEVNYMTAKCTPNGGVKVMYHDYDVVCNNNAEFTYDLVEFSKLQKSAIKQIGSGK